MLKDDKSSSVSATPIVAVSSFSLYDITKHIAGDTLEIVNILPLGVDPHSFEPTPKLMAQIEKSNLIFYSGAGLEPWTHGFNFKNRAIDMSQHVILRELDADEHHEEHNQHEHGESTIDPHYWLDFVNMKKVTTLISNELVKLQPQYKNIYEKNTQAYFKMLDKLDRDYKKQLSSCRLKRVILNHNAIGYLANNYGFKVDSLSGLSPEAQPSAKDLTRLFKEIKEEGISTIFFENFVNDKAIKTVANDAKVKLEVFQALGNITAQELHKKLTYEKIMYINLEKLSKALMCH